MWHNFLGIRTRLGADIGVGVGSLLGSQLGLGLMVVWDFPTQTLLGLNSCQLYLGLSWFPRDSLGVGFWAALFRDIPCIYKRIIRIEFVNDGSKSRLSCCPHTPPLVNNETSGGGEGRRRRI